MLAFKILLRTAQQTAVVFFLWGFLHFVQNFEHIARMSNVRLSERERDTQRVQKNGTSRHAIGAPEHSSRSLIGRALALFSRAQMLCERAEEQSYVKSARAEMLMKRVRIPVCFVRRSGVIDDVCDNSALYDNDGVVLNFDGRSKRTTRPVLAQTNLLIDRAPPDLHAASYEVRYLTLFELALLAVRSVARSHLKDSSVAAMRTARQARDSETPHVSKEVFDNDVDVAYEPKNDLNEAVRRDFAHALEHLRVSKIQQPFEHRLPVVTRTQDIIERHNVQQPTCRVFALDIERSTTKSAAPQSALEADGGADDESDELGNRARAQERYGETVQFRLRYLHLKPFATGHVGKSRSVLIPARLFAKQYDDPHARKTNTSDVGVVERALRERLSRALARFARPVRSNDDLVALFGDEAHMKRFEALLRWRTREFAHASNQRAASYAIIGALHRFMDDIERCTFDDDEFERVFGVETRAWDCWRGAEHKRRHAKLFSFVKGTDTAYNDWDNDNGRPATQRGITQMMAPDEIGARFYDKHWRAELQSEAQRAFVCNSGDADEPARREQHRQFWQTWCATARRAAHAGSTPIGTHTSASSALATMLAFDCDPLDCADPSALNDYGSIFQQQQRQMAPFNPFTRFANSVLNYVSSRSGACRWEQTDSDGEAKIYAESTLSRHIIKNCVAHIERALRDPDDDNGEQQEQRRSLPPLERGPLRDMWTEALERARSSNTTKDSNWSKIQRALRLDASAAINNFVSAWGSVEHIVQRAAMFDRSASALNTPFSTLYDFGVHCLRCREGEEKLANARIAQSVVAKKSVVANEPYLQNKSAIESDSESWKDEPEQQQVPEQQQALEQHTMPLDCVDEKERPVALAPKERPVAAEQQKPPVLTEQSDAPISMAPQAEGSTAEKQKVSKSKPRAIGRAKKSRYAYVIKPPSESKMFSSVGVTSSRKRALAAHTARVFANGDSQPAISDEQSGGSTRGRKSTRAKRETKRLCI